MRMRFTPTQIRFSRRAAVNMRKALALSILVLMTLPVQSAQRFETASLKPASDSPRGATPESPDRFISPNSTLAELIRVAYELQPSQVVGGETWMRSMRFDVEAKAAGIPTRDTMRAMVRSLLEERFGLRISREIRSIPVFVMMQSGRQFGPNLKSSDDTCAATPQADPPLECRSQLQAKPSPNGLLLSYRTAAMNMSEFATWLAPYAGRYVVDRSGLSDRFALSLSFAPGNSPSTNAANDAPPSIFTAVREQLGLALNPENAPVEVVVIQSAHLPTEN